MSSVNWNDFTPVGSPAPVDWSQFEPVKPTGAVRKLADIGVSFAGGAVGATKAIADAGGAGNAVSTKLGAAQDSVQGWLSPARQAEKAARAQIIKNAEQSGSAWNEVAAHLGGIVEAPVSTLAEAAGSVVPVVASMFTPAGRSAAGRTLMGIGVGGAQGAGAVKGGIYDAVQQQHIDRGSTPEAARAAAEEAQAYGGDNTGNIAFGAGLGAVAGTTGVEHLLSRAVGGQGSAGSVLRRLATGAVTEGVPEAIQGGQERYAANVAQQRAGFDVPTWQGVVGQATAEGAAGGMLGGVTGAASRARRAAQPEAQAAAQQPVTETPAPREQFEDVPDIDPSAGPLSKAASMAGSLSLAPREPAPVPVDPRSALEAVADRLPEQGQRAVRMTLADLARDDLPAGVRAMREIEARELAAAAPAPEPEVSDMQPGRVLRTFDARTDEAPPTRLGLMPDESVRAQAGIDFTPIEPTPAPPNAFAEQINRLALDSDLTPGAPLRLNEAHALRSQAIDAGVPASVVPHPSGRGYDVQPSVRLSPEQRAVTPQTKPGLLGLDDGPSGRMIAGGDTVRHETRAEATARRNALETERQAVDAERERRTALGLSIGARAAPAAVNDATSAALAPGATAAPAVPAAGTAGVEAAGVVAGQAPQPVQQTQARAPGQRLGRDSVPIEGGGKAFKTKRAAAEAKKLQPMMRVVSVDGGYALAEKTPAQLAAEAKAARRLSVARAGTAGMPIAAHEFIATNGGLSRDVAADLGVEGNPRIGNRTLYAARGKGMSLERATEALSQAGYIEDGDQGAALDMIRRSLTQPQYTAEGWQQLAEAEDQVRYQDHLAAQQDAAQAEDFDPFAPLGDYTQSDLVADPEYGSATDEQKAKVRALLERAESLGIDTEAIQEDVANQTASEKAYYDRIENDLSVAISGRAGGDSARATDQDGRAGSGSAGQEGDRNSRPVDGEAGRSQSEEQLARDRDIAQAREDLADLETQHKKARGVVRKNLAQRIERLSAAIAEQEALLARGAPGDDVPFSRARRDAATPDMFGQQQSEPAPVTIQMGDGAQLYQSQDFRRLQAEVATLAAGQWRRMEIERQRFGRQEPTQYAALASMGNGETEVLWRTFPDSRQPLTDADLRALYDEKVAQRDKTAQRKDDAIKSRLDAIREKGITVGASWADAETMTNTPAKPKGERIKVEATVKAISDDGMITVEGTRRGSGYRYQWTVAPDSRLFDNYPGFLSAHSESDLRQRAHEISGWNHHNTAPERAGVFLLDSGSYAKFDGLAWYRGESTPRAALKTEIPAAATRPKDRFPDQRWRRYADYSTDAFNEPKALRNIARDRGVATQATANGLTSYTPADLSARADAAAAAQREQARQQQAQDQRAQADAERGDFTLTGSDRPADEAEARGQRGMFDGNSKTEPTDEPTTIQDFGEKIGGARKDTATKTSRAAPKPKDDRPAWARRFSIGQATKSSTPGEEGRWFIRDERSTDWTGQARITGDRKGYATREEAEQAIPLIAVAQKHRAVPAQDGKYEIWRTISDKKRVKVIDRVFDTRDDAMRYMAENPVEIIEANTTFGEADLPRPDSEQRTGVARRMGPAKDADFMSTFGFRGVEFGNWQNQTERQQLLDDAYDGLLDLAEVMGIPPKAIGLNGDLALAFGARGHGLSGARAHYEPARVVINLTKMNGAGSLAHEWLHALDHYLARQDGKASSEWVLEKDGTRTLKVGDDSMASGGFSYGDRSGVRQELREAFAHVLQTMSKKAQQYVQDTAKADEFVGKARDDVQTKLARIRADLSSHNEYAKRNNKPATAEQLADFDTLAEQITQGRALETSLKATSDKKDAKGRVPLSGMRWTNDALDGLSAIIKAVRGRSGFNAEHQGELDRLRTSMDFYSQRLKMLADAQQGEEKTRMVPTEFAMNAKELDQGRGKDYWTTPHEMAARAFQGYVEDKIAERGAVSPFLNHAPENVGIPTPWGWKRPYPHGAERKAINAAFDKLVGTIKTRDTEKGVEVYAGRRESAQTVGKPTDRAVMDMAREGNSAQDILKLIAGTSRSRFNKQVARLLLKTGTSPDVRFDTADLGGADGFKFKAKYSRAHHAVTLTPAAAGQAEQIVLHELIHAATLAALDRKGMASAQMRRLYEHVKKQGGVAGQYGMKNVGEFVAEVFTNPDFQRSLKDLSAPTGSRLKTAWDSFVRILKGILGIPHDASNALSQALDTGVALMREDMGVRARRAARNGADAHAGVRGDDPLDAFPASFLAELAASDDLFQNPRSASTSVVGALADIDPSIQFVGDVAASDERSESGADNKLLFRTTKGSDFFVFERGSQVWIDVSRLGEGDGGSAIYSAAMDYAANTGKQLVGDPAGLSDIAMRRRLEAMISSALKHGSTDHMAPHDRQVSGDEKLGIPALKWQNGDTIGNVQRMIDVSLAALAAHVPEFRRARYDFESRTFRTGEGKPLSDEVLHEWASQHPRMRAAGQGRRSIKRGILLNTLAHTAGSERPGLLEQALRQPDQLVGPQANGIFYAGSPDEDSAYFGSGSDSESPAARRMGDALSGLTVTNLKRLAGFKATDLRPLALQTLGRRQLVDVYGNQLPELKAYSDLMARMDADKNEAGAGADQLANDWAKLPDERALADLMHDATLAQMDPAKEFVPGDNRVQYGALRNRYQALTPAAREVYAKARDSYSEHMSDVRSAIKDRIHRAEMSSQRKAEMLKRLDDEFFGRVKGVYFPLSRFGQYVVVVKDADGKVANVSRAETMAEADSTRRQLAGLFPADKGFAVGKVIKAKDFVADRDAVGRGFMEQLYGVLDKQGIEPKHRAELEDALGQLYLSSLPDLSWAKHGIHRKGTPGFSQDARRAFAQNVFHGASYLAKLRYGDQLQDQLKEMQRRVDEGTGDGAFDSVRAQQVVDEMTKRHEAAMNPKTNALSTALTSIGFMFHLGLSPASAMVNLTQTALVAYPVMGARWGFAKSSAALLKASNEAVRGGNDITRSLSADEKKAFDEAVRSGVIDVTMAHDLAGIAQGEDRNVSWKLQPVMKAASFLFHRAEKFNRQVTFVAAYRLARGAGADAQAAYEQAVQATYDGHFDYSANNRPRVMQGNVARVLLLFKQYSQNMIYTLARNAQQSLAGATPEDRARARKALGGLLTMHALAAGALGLPMVTTLLAAASMLGGDDDEPWDAKVALQNMLADAFGQKPAEVLSHGLSRLTPWDISGRVALDKLIFPDVQEGLEGQRLAESAMASALGPVAGIGVNALRGAQLIGQGEYLRGLEAMAPSVLRGPLKSFRYGTEGARDRTGIVIQDEVDAAALLGQAAGFSPSDVRNAYEGKAAIVQHDRALQARRRALVERFAMAAMAKDDDGKTEAREAIHRFNEKNPDRRILPMQLAQSVRQREKRIREAEDGVFLPKKRRESLEVGRFATSE